MMMIMVSEEKIEIGCCLKGKFKEEIFASFFFKTAELPTCCFVFILRRNEEGENESRVRSLTP